MPLWFIPPLVLVIPPLIWGWLTYRVMGFDVLAEHASVAERQTILREHRWPMLWMGTIAGYLGAAPSLVWAFGALTSCSRRCSRSVAVWLYTLVFAFSALWFAHYALAALQALRSRPVRRRRWGRSRCRVRLLPCRRRANPHSIPEDPATMNFGLLIIGDEILSGKREDKHLPKVIELLSARGLSLSWARYVGDDPARITADLKDAFASGDVVFSCGGIGATPDDHTRQCAAAALGVALELHPQARELILERMRDLARERGVPYEPDRDDNRHRLNMGVFRSAPRSSEPVQQDRRLLGPAGDCGTQRRVLRAGVSVMAWPMIEWVLDTHYRDLQRARGAGERSVIVFGAMEATLTPLMESIEARFDGIKVFSLPSVDHPEYGRHIELGVKGHAAALDAAYAELLAGLKAHDAALGPELVRNDDCHRLRCTKGRRAPT
jgi:molybdopterin-biosynthesis enzyme MoeA-like protein